MLVYILLAEGFEETEAVTPIDMLRRAGVTVKTVGVTGSTVTGSHGIPVGTDCALEDVRPEEADMIVLPGGMPGTTNLYANEKVKQLVLWFAEHDKFVAAICAAPSVVLGGLGLLDGRRATCYPGMEDGMTGATPVKTHFVVDGKIITGCGVGGALNFSCALIEALCGKEHAAKTAEKAVHQFG